MAPESPPQPAKAGCEARLFSISSFGKFQLLAEMHGLAGDGAGIMREEPAVEAIYQPGDLLLAVQFEGKVHMAYISRVEVGGGSDEEEGSRSGGSEKKGSGGSEEEGSRSGGSEEEWSRSGSEEDGSIRGSEEDGSIRGSEEDGSIRGSEEEQSDQTSTNSSSVTEADDKEKSHTVKELNEKKRHLQIRIWQEYCVLALYEGERWKVTKQQPIQWLQEDQIEETRDKIKIENDRNEVKMTWNLDFLGLSKQMCIFGFSGPLESSEAVEIFINSELSPDIMDYNITKLLGSGATCEVYRVDTTYAIKMMKLDKNFDDTYALEYKEPREVTILSSFSHSAVVSFFQAWAADGIYKIYLKGSSSEGSGERFDDENSDPDDNLEDERELKYVAIQMECCGRFSHKHEKHLLTLLDLLDAKDRKIDVEEAWFLFKEIAKGVQGIHRKGVIHRDLKPRNIFFGHAATNTIKIGDFGHACWAKQYAAAEGGTPNRGTSGYSAPELAGEKPSPTYKADIYSLGIILLDLFYLFKSSHQRSEVLTKLGTDQYPNPADPDWYGDVTLLKKLVASSPSERPSADEILEYISNRGL